MIAADLIRRGYKIAIPYGEDWDFDLIVCRDERLERVQCKYTCSDGIVIYVRASSQSLTNGLSNLMPWALFAGMRNCQRSPGATRERLPLDLMEPAGFEPAAFRMQTERSTN